MITVSVYVSQGHGVVVVQGPNWCWEYDTTVQTWHERKSHLVDYWRGKFPVAGLRDRGSAATRRAAISP